MHGFLIHVVFFFSSSSRNALFAPRAGGPLPRKSKLLPIATGEKAPTTSNRANTAPLTSRSSPKPPSTASTNWLFLLLTINCPVYYGRRSSPRSLDGPWNPLKSQTYKKYPSPTANKGRDDPKRGNSRVTLPKRKRWHQKRCARPPRNSYRNPLTN